MSTEFISAHEDPAGEPVHAMQVVLRMEKTERPTTTAVLEATAKAVVQLLDAPWALPGGEWHDAVSRWQEGRIRKIVRRGRAAQWDAAVAQPGVTVVHNGASVHALVPGSVDEVSPAIARLQMTGWPELEPGEAVDFTTLAQGTLAIVINPGLELSLGKAAAQVGHVAQLAWLGASGIERLAWEEADYPLALLRATPAVWRVLFVTSPLVVHDAGFTEVVPGTPTAAGRWVEGNYG